MLPLYGEDEHPPYDGVKIFTAGTPGDGAYKMTVTPTDDVSILDYDEASDEDVEDEPGQAVEIDVIAEDGQIHTSFGMKYEVENAFYGVNVGVVPGYEPFGIQSVVFEPAIPLLSAMFPKMFEPGGFANAEVAQLPPNTEYAVTITPTPNTSLNGGAVGQAITATLTTDRNGSGSITVTGTLGAGGTVTGDMSIGGSSVV